MTTPFPLAWPTHIPRSRGREAGRFKTTLAAAMNNVSGGRGARCWGSGPMKGLTWQWSMSLFAGWPRICTPTSRAEATS